ncbi:MAG: tetratricopeptide repeat protein [Eubacterium sp.]
MDYQSISNEELEKMVANKDGEAICELGERFLYGKNGSPQNLTRAYQLFHKGEKRGLARAYVGLGEMYRQGLLMVKNENLAREYYQKANVPYPNGTPMGAAPVYQEQEDDMPPIQEEDPVYPRKQPAERPQYTAVSEVPVNTNTNVITDRDLAIRLDEAEKSREKGNYDYVKQICQEVFRNIAGVKMESLCIREMRISVTLKYRQTGSWHFEHTIRKITRKWKHTFCRKMLQGYIHGGGILRQPVIRSCISRISLSSRIFSP